MSRRASSPLTVAALLCGLTVSVAACATSHGPTTELAPLAPSPDATPTLEATPAAPNARTDTFDPGACGIPITTEQEATLRHGLAQALVEEHAYAQALEHITWLRQYRSTWWTVHLQFAEAHYLLTADGTEALSALQDAILLKPVNPRALMLMGQIYEDQGQNDKAEFAYRQVLLWRPDDHAAQQRLARLRHRAGDLEEARALFEALLAQSRDDILAVTELAVILEKQGRLTEAEAMFKKLLELHPDRFTGYKYLILFYQRTGQTRAGENAMQELERHLGKTRGARRKPRHR